MEQEETAEFKASLVRMKPNDSLNSQFVTSGLFCPYDEAIRKAGPESMNEEPLFTSEKFPQRSNLNNQIKDTQHPTGRPFYLESPRIVPESDMVKLHQNHVIMKTEGVGKSSAIYECMDLIDHKFKAVKVIKYKSKSL